MRVHKALPYAVIGVVGIGLVSGLLHLARSNVQKAAITTPSPITKAVKGATSCAVDAKLVNACRPWVSAAVGGYTMVASDQTTQFSFSEKRMNDPNVLNAPSSAVTLTKTLDFIHVYKTSTSLSFNSLEKSYYSRSGTYLQVNWKPASKWGDAGGGDATVNANIDTFAKAVKALGSKKILLSIFHEPEDGVSSGNCTTNAAGASSGSPAQYVAMWQNVRARFDALGVSNVVWNMNYMGYEGWNCLVPLLWPGNNYVDWITWDPYGSGAKLFTEQVNKFYSYLSANSNATHDYASKTWGLSEYGYNVKNGSTQANAVAFWDDAKSAINTNKFPKLKLYSVFDTNVNGTSQVGLDFNSAVALPEQTAYNAFVDAILAKDSAAQPATDTTKPTVSFTAPTSGETVKGTITITLSASDNVGVTKVLIYVDDTKLIKTDTNAADGWQSAWSSSGVSDGSHTLKAIASDAAGNSTTVTRSITVANTTTTTQNPGSPAPADSPPASPVVVATTGEEVAAVESSGSVQKGDLITLDTTTVVNPEKIAQIKKVEFYIGDKLVQVVSAPPFALNTEVLDPGTFTITQRTYYLDGSMAEVSQVVEVKGASTTKPSQPVKKVAVAKSSRMLPLTLGIGGLVVVAAAGAAGFLLLKRRRNSSFKPYVQDADVTSAMFDLRKRS